MNRAEPVNPPRVDDVSIVSGAGPWDTKSGGKLNVLFQIPMQVLLERSFKYSKAELRKSPDIRGLRAYSVSNIPKGALGANEWHRLRRELVFCLEGSVVWTCEDLFGKKKEFIISTDSGLEVPPFILHTYLARVDQTRLLVITNTLFNPNDPATHDSFSASAFKGLQAQQTKK